MSETRRIVATHHALMRYRQRYSPGATAAEFEEWMVDAVPAPAWLRKQCQSMPSYQDGREVWMKGEAVVIAQPWSDSLVLVTLFDLHWFRPKVRKRKPPAQHNRHRRGKA